MRSRSFLTGVLLAIASAVGAVLFRRRAARRRERVELYFGDGTMVSLTRADEAEPFLRRAREILDLAS